MPTAATDKDILVQRAIKGVSRFFGGRKLVFPFADYVLMAYQEPSCVSIWKDGEPPTLHFSSFDDKAILDTASLGIQPPGAHLLTPKLHALPLNDTNLPGMFATVHDIKQSGFHPNKDKTERLGCILHECRPALPDRFWQALHTALKEPVRPLSRRPQPSHDAQVLSTDAVDRFLAPMRVVLDDAFEELREHAALSVQTASGVEALNLFSVVRTVRGSGLRYGSFPYTASLLLSNSQRERLAAICAPGLVGMRTPCEYTHCESRCVDALETPLGPHSRSIFDSVFYSGCVDFGLVGVTGEAGQWRDVSGPEPEDQRRHKVEECLYRAITQGRQSRILYVPIHVGGAAWMAVFTLAHIDDPDAWDDTYSFYRDIVAKLSDRIRIGAQEAYRSLLAKEVTTALGRREPDLASVVNRAWEQIAQVYPFRQVRLGDGDSTKRGSSEIRLPSGQQFILAAMDNPFCPSQVEYGYIAEPTIAKEIQHELDRLTVVELQAEEVVRQRLQEQSHTIFNSLPLGLLRIAEDPESTPAQAKRAAADARRLTEVLNASFHIACGRGLPESFPMSVTGILEWLGSNLVSSACTADLTIDRSLADAHLNPDDAEGAFTVLWNLWSNAEKMARGKGETSFRVIVQGNADGRGAFVIFQNRGPMALPWREFLLSRGQSPNRPGEISGLEITRRRIMALGWKVDAVDIVDRTDTRIVLKISLPPAVPEEVPHGR